jgi:hypothetical protein
VDGLRGNLLMIDMTFTSAILTVSNVPILPLYHDLSQVCVMCHLHRTLWGEGEDKGDRSRKRDKGTEEVEEEWGGING